MKIGVLGIGSWGFSLAALLSRKGYTVVAWTRNDGLARHLSQTKVHHKLGRAIDDKVIFTSDLDTVLDKVDILVEAVTSSGVRSVLENIAHRGGLKCPLVITSKGIEQDSCFLLPEVVADVFGSSYQNLVGCLGGPSLAEEVMNQLPTSVVCSAYDSSLMLKIQEIFQDPFFRVYLNSDMQGVSLGGAMKNIIAIACGISDGLGFGDNAKAALIARGLYEIQKLSSIKRANPRTLTGLAGIGDLCVTGFSKLSRNYTFGHCIGRGGTVETAKTGVGMVIEGAYTCVSALQLAKKASIDMPITKVVYAILYDHLDPKEAVEILLKKDLGEEFG
jgi:glycerol-3-phosphate dehydrogenase (NAD(P)+)